VFVVLGSRAVVGLCDDAHLVWLATIIVLRIELGPLALLCDIDFTVCRETGAPGCCLDSNLNLIHDPDLIDCHTGEDWPEDGNRCGNDGDIDLENGENVYNRCVVCHVEDGDSTGAVDGQRDQATNWDCAYTDIVLVVVDPLCSRGIFTYITPKVKSVINPALLFPAILNMPKNGMGVHSTSRSRIMLLAEWPKNMAKNSSGRLLPQPMQVPGLEGYQSLAIGVHGKTANKKKHKPQSVLKMMRVIVTRRARRYLELDVVDAVSAKRRRYWRRIASLMNVALAQ
jgi:hypothetical protein